MGYGRCVFTANGEIQAQQVRAFLAAAGISSEVRGESLRHTHGLTLDGLGMVEILVSGVDEARARALLASAEDGEFRLDDDAEVTAASAQNQDTGSVIADLEQRLAGAWVNRDRPFIDALLASDWTVTDPSGRILTKQQVLEETFSSVDRRIDTMAVDDVRVRLLGPVAVATGRTRATGSYQGRQASVTLRFTDVFHFREGRWQVVASQGTTITP